MYVESLCPSTFLLLSLLGLQFSFGGLFLVSTTVRSIVHQNVHPVLVTTAFKLVDAVSCEPKAGSTRDMSDDDMVRLPLAQQLCKVVQMDVTPDFRSILVFR